MSPEEVRSLAQSILENVRTILINSDYPLSVSIGVGMRGRDEPQEAFIKKVDEALYKAKNSGRGRVEWAAA
ncbi:Probable diguanylate cyclase YdaM [Raoultella terrigena]|nr:Probable diguanylate cyclase YdaM [Raoultella terrigena]